MGDTRAGQTLAVESGLIENQVQSLFVWLIGLVSEVVSKFLMAEYLL
jgi:hypothetical protein